MIGVLLSATLFAKTASIISPYHFLYTGRVEDRTSLSWNPARINQVKTDSVKVASAQKVLGYRHDVIHLKKIFKGLTLGLGYDRLGTQDLSRVSYINNVPTEIETFHHTIEEFRVVLGKRVTKRLDMGVSYRMARIKVDQYQARGYTLDAGANFALNDNWKTYLWVQNVLPLQIDWDQGLESSTNDPELFLGLEFAYNPILVGIHTDFDRFRVVNEWTFKSSLAIVADAVINKDLERESFAMGIKINLGMVSFTVSRYFYTQSLLALTQNRFVIELRSS